MSHPWTTTGRTALRAGAAALFSLALASCSNKLTGSATATLEGAGTFTISPDECYSGERQSFFGVQLQDTKSSNLVRIVKPATSGYEVLVKLPGKDDAARFTSGECQSFDVSVERQNVRVNDIYNVDGRLVVECAAGANHFSANITFANCH